MDRGDLLRMGGPGGGGAITCQTLPGHVLNITIDRWVGGGSIGGDEKWDHEANHMWKKPPTHTVTQSHA